MIKVITYGTYDLLHRGHIRLLERAKALGDYLIVGITADGFDLARGKINVQQSLMERIESVRATGLADEIIVEEYEGQKIDDIRRLSIDIFTVGSDWAGYFDYLNAFCKVIYLDRTEGISSTEIRSEKRELRIGMTGESSILNKFERECRYVNGISVTSLYTMDGSSLSSDLKQLICPAIEDAFDKCDAVYIASHPSRHYTQVKKALQNGKHVLCESPISTKTEEYEELYSLAADNNLILEESLKTAYSTAYYRLLLLVKSGCIGNIISVDTVCTSLKEIKKDLSNTWNSITAWGPTALLPVFQILGIDYISKSITSYLLNGSTDFDLFTKIDFVYPHAVASIKIGKGVKSEGELIITGTNGYVYVPAPWWKTDYFELRFENSADNKKYFYQLDGEGIRYEIVNFVKSVNSRTSQGYISPEVSKAIVQIIEDFNNKRGVVYI